ncbi:MAG: ATP-binding protein [Hungatella sp.]|nr:ATP-binding protein [Hungatella sp.]
MNTRPLVLYRNFRHQDLFDKMAGLLMGDEESGRTDAYDCASQLIELAADYGFQGNLWHCFLALCLANHENAYSVSCEIRGDMGGTLSNLARQDFRILKELFHQDITKLDRLSSGSSIWKDLSSFVPSGRISHFFNERVRDRIIEFSVALQQAADIQEFQNAVTEFYREFGVGKYGLNKAFRIKEDGHEADIEPIVNVEHVYLDDIVGYESQKQKLIENTENFIQGKGANNVLLFGDAGTGKSSCIKGILNAYYGQGLRIVEVYKHQFHALSSVLEQVQDRNYRFIVYMDDLSFEESELEYKYLKAIIEGGLGRRPQNVLIYATSNRRHLIREKFSDKRELDDELHVNDTVQEKLSLVARFGVTIYFGSPEKKEFQNIVRVLAKRNQIHMPEEELFAEAIRWEMNHGGLSGRTAAQFITYLLGKQ